MGLSPCLDFVSQKAVEVNQGGWGTTVVLSVGGVAIAEHEIELCLLRQR